MGQTETVSPDDYCVVNIGLCEITVSVFTLNYTLKYKLVAIVLCLLDLQAKTLKKKRYLINFFATVAW